MQSICRTVNVYGKGYLSESYRWGKCEQDNLMWKHIII